MHSVIFRFKGLYCKPVVCILKIYVKKFIETSAILQSSRGERTKVILALL